MPEATSGGSVAATSPTVCIRLVFADRGAFHTETVRLPAENLGDYERIIDFVREEQSVMQRLYVDLARLVTVSVVEEDASGL